MSEAIRGRGEHLAAFDDVFSSERAGLLLVGNAGAGKTLLARAMLDRVGRLGGAHAYVAASRSLQAVPLGAFAPLLPSGALSGSLLELLQNARDAVHELAADGALVLAIDDAHLLDELSAGLIGQLATADRCTLIVTARAAERLPDAIEALRSEGTLLRREVGDLDRSPAEQLVTDLVGGTVSADTLAQVWRLARGNPLLTRELVLGAIDAGTLIQDDGTWRHTQPLATSQRLQEVVTARIGAVSSDAVAAFELVAVGEPVSVGAIEELAEPTGLSELRRRGLVTLDADGHRGTIRSTHPAHAEAVLTGLPRSRRRALSGRLADWLEARGIRRDDDAVRLALWRLDAGDATAETLLTGGHRALANFDDDLAERLARAAIAAGGESAAHLLHGETLATRDDPLDADAAFQRAVASAADPPSRVRALLARATHLYLRRGRPAEALALLGEAHHAGNDDQLFADVAATRALLLSFVGDFPRTLAAADVALSHGRTRRQTLVDTLAVTTFVQAFNGEANAALAGTERGLAAAGIARDTTPLATTKLALNRALALAALGQLREAEASALAGLQQAQAADARDAIGVWGVIAATVYTERGRPESARAVLAEVEGTLQRRDPLAMRRTLAAVDALAAAQRGALGDAEKRLATLPDAHRPDRFAHWIWRARAWLAAQHGDTTTAVASALHGADWGERTGHLVARVQCLHDLVHFGHAEQVAAQLHAAAAGSDGLLLAALAEHAVATANHDAAALEDVAHRLGQFGALLHAVAAEAGAARAYRAQDKRRLAEAASARADLLAAGCEGAQLPGLAASRSTLSRRELEVARLAMRGLTSRAIAEKLVVSIRTVDNHLGRVYTKLGVHSRHELSAALTTVAAQTERV